MPEPASRDLPTVTDAMTEEALRVWFRMPERRPLATYRPESAKYAPNYARPMQEPASPRVEARRPRSAAA